MPSTVPMIGLSPSELPWIRLLVQLLRHPDPGVAELARQALGYINDAASAYDSAQSSSCNSVG